MVLTATMDGSMPPPKVNIRRKGLEPIESSERFANKKNTDYYKNKVFDYTTAYSLLELGFRVARPQGDTGFLVLFMNPNTKNVSSLNSNGRSSRQCSTWDRPAEDTDAEDWTLADYDESKPEDDGYIIPQQIQEDFGYEHLRDGEAKEMSMQFFALAIQIDRRNQDPRMKAISLTALWNSKNAAVNGIVQVNIRKEKENKND